jgi:hypothetical protein
LLIVSKAGLVGEVAIAWHGRLLLVVGRGHMPVGKPHVNRTPKQKGRPEAALMQIDNSRA